MEVSRDFQVPGAGDKSPVTKSMGSLVGTSAGVGVLEKRKIPYRREWNYSLVSPNPQRVRLMLDFHPTCSGPCADAVFEQPFESAPFTDLTSARIGNSVHHYVVTYLCFRSKPQERGQSCSRNVE
jgi:hypothetical protein